MRKIIFSLLIVFSGTSILHAQGVAINTNGNAPDSSAMLDVQSTNKGFLLPRMTQFQRLALTPVNGLLVYETTSDRLYQYQDGAWRFFINNSYWTKSTTRDRLYNGNDSIGLGTTTPDEKLHVVGKIKVSDRIDAGGVIEGAGLSSLGSLYVNGTSLMQGAVTGGSTATYGGLITTNTGITINDAAGTLTYKASGDDKGFVQLSGDNLRLGTNIANTDGRVVIRTQGQDQVNINDQGITLVNNGKIKRTATGDFNLVPSCYGKVKFDGTKLSGTPNFTVIRVSEGNFEIYSPDIISTSTVVATAGNNIATSITAGYLANGVYRILTFLSGGGKVDCGFSFILYNQ